MSTPDPSPDPYGEAVRGALAHAARGWQVFPLVPGEKRPAVTRWQDRATLDPARIERCWSTRTPAGPYGVAIACGPSRLVVVDLDQPKPHTALSEPWQIPGVVDGADVLAVLADRAGHPDPATLGTHTVLTPSGGRHLYFTAPAPAPARAEPAARPRGTTAGSRGPRIATRGA
ncbi:MAG: bifunctional DNA primase/polymerase, partial [Actinobacteria bacterium]|nr:bifunctional DNA primase/polymerase [Actinomycetota bacterium]